MQAHAAASSEEPKPMTVDANAEENAQKADKEAEERKLLL